MEEQLKLAFCFQLKKRAQKKAETLSQFFGLHLPMKTTLFGKAINTYPKAVPKRYYTLKCLWQSGYVIIMWN